MTGITVITVARKPISENSIVENTLKWGCGGLDIDGARLAAKVEGRWPSNIVFGHLPGCRVEGVKTIQANWGRPRRANTPSTIGDNGIYSNKGWKTEKVAGAGLAFDYGDAEGKEVVPSWICAPGCPVHNLDIQSESKNGGGGGKSRYFKQVSSDG